MDFKYGKCNGSITIYLALTLTIILSLFFCVIESARIVSLKSRSKAVSYLAMDSSFSEFAKQLYEEYGIFGVFTTEADFLNSVQDYALKNINPSNAGLKSTFDLLTLKLEDICYNNIYHITDNDGLLFAGQVTEYEKYRAAANKISDISRLNNAVSDDVALPAQIDDNGVVLKTSDVSVLTDMSGSKSNLYKDWSSSDATTLKENLSSKITSLLKSNLLLFFISDNYSISPTELSDEAVNKLPSHICTLSEEAKAVQSGNIKDEINSVIDKGLFISYINNSFSSYKDLSVNWDLSLKYQREYILSGMQADDDNLLSAALSIVSLRAAFNFTYLLTDGEKRDAAINLANSLTLSTPLASQFAAFTILSLWSYGEAIIDVRDLFNGKKVPLMKNSGNWTLSLEGILSLGKSTVSNNDNESGYTYDEYLNMTLFLMDPFTMYYRCMDLIQIDICENVNSQFIMNACIVASDIHFSYKSVPLFSSVILIAKPDVYTFSVDMLFGYD